ncbi:MAG TPA: hypothetical protein VIA19_08610 [Burkholderiales bacterium]|jgi:hypothetical protein
MTLIPRHPVTRLTAAAWLLASAVMLTVTLLRPDITGSSRSALVGLTPLYWLALPLGHVGVMAGIELRLRLYLELGFVPSVLAEGLYLWTALTVLGYAQWFVLVPLLARKLRQLSAFLSKRSAAR